MVRPGFLAVATLSLAGFASHVHAQAINIDFGADSGTPDADYAADGMMGFWNSVTNVISPTPLMDIDGNITAASFGLDPTGIVFESTTDQTTVGNDAALLQDFIRNVDGIMITVSFAGLEPGEYEVLTYTTGPASTPTMSWVFTNGILGDNVMDVQGVFPDDLEMEKTHAMHTVIVGADGLLDVTVKGEDTSFINGIQLIPTPIPLTSTLGIGVATLLAPSRRRRLH
ncbi:MAG: hypothetical protein AAF432_13350 [Planctomycetota bacterium]